MTKIKKLENAIRSSWDRNTCHYKFLWDNNSIKSTGHCRVVSLIVQDYFGGDILMANVRGYPKWTHYWNIIGEKEIDLTRDQFPKLTKFTKTKKITRKEALSSKRTQKGYTLLKSRVKKLIN